MWVLLLGGFNFDMQKNSKSGRRYYLKSHPNWETGEVSLRFAISKSNPWLIDHHHSVLNNWL